MRPDADAGEEMALREASKISGRNILDTPCVNDTGGYVALLYKFAQPLGRELVEFVVVGGHPFDLPRYANAHRPNTPMTPNTMTWANR
jgi:hypothetical protein